MSWPSRSRHDALPRYLRRVWKGLGFAGAKKYQLGFWLEQRPQVGRRHRGDVGNRPVLDQRARRDDEAALQLAFVDQRRGAVGAAQEEVVVGAFEGELH